MLKKGNQLPVNLEYLVTHHENNRHLEGEMLTLVETFGFEKVREEAVKSLVRRTIWDYFQHMKYVPKELEPKVVELFSLREPR